MFLNSALQVNSNSSQGGNKIWNPIFKGKPLFQSLFVCSLNVFVPITRL